MKTGEFVIPHTISPGLLLCLSAPSGAGKTTLAHRLLQELPEAMFSISYTTRPPRGSEKNDVDYHFIDTATFKRKIDGEEFVEWAEVHGNFYGSSQFVVDKTLSSMGIAVFDIDVQGGYAIKRKYPDAILAFILPPSLGELERRLRDRKTDTEDVIARRMLVARSEMERGIQGYDYLILNDDFERAYAQLKSIVVAEKCRNGRVTVPAMR